MHLWTLHLLFLPITFSQEQSYECGAHGKFEYCVDGVPNCVIGCHCHPGYYFDTGTKICEPNSNLLESRRRHISRFSEVVTTPADSYFGEQPPTPTPDADTKLKDIGKDADDLGDWLYNQFFKTVENQVINKTNEEGLPTRRFGSSLFKPAKKRSKKKKKSKKNKKEKDLKKKLLKITEDDSLFDSSSPSDESDSSIAGSDQSEDEGHRKIIMFNKKPKPPLPSFIFLPNIETPFYPPIGLPPPPMFPLPIPIPPFVTPGCSTNKPDVTTSADSTTAPPGTTNVPSETTNAPESTPLETTTPITTLNPEETSPPQKRFLRNRNKNFKQMHYLRQLRAKLNGAKKFKDTDQNLELNNEPPDMGMDPSIDFPNYGDGELPKDYPGNGEEDYNVPNMNYQLKSQFPNKPINPNTGKVDFKYLTQLIHKIKTPKQPKNLVSSLKKVDLQNMRSKLHHSVSLPGDAPTRRYLQEEPDASVYTKLGRQIAELIRNYDNGGGGQQDNIDVPTQSKYQTQPIFNENSFASHSFWERSVRSPLKRRESIRHEDYLKKSDEKLFDLENKVEIEATTKPDLSLRDLENIVSVIKTAHSKIRIKTNDNLDEILFNKNLNINLLPQQGPQPTVSKIQNSTETPSTESTNHPNTLTFTPKLANNKLYTYDAPKTNKTSRSKLISARYNIKNLNVLLKSNDIAPLNNVEKSNYISKDVPSILTRPIVVKKNYINPPNYTTNIGSKLNYKNRWLYPNTNIVNMYGNYPNAFPKNIWINAENKRNESRSLMKNMNQYEVFRNKTLYQGKPMSLANSLSLTPEKPMQTLNTQNNALKKTLRPVPDSHRTLRGFPNMKFYNYNTDFKMESLPFFFSRPATRKPSSFQSYFHHDFHNFDYFD